MKKNMKVITLSSLVVFLLMACNLTTTGTPEPVINADPTTTTESTATPTDLIEIELSATPTVSMDVVITAETGSLSIRRGPSIYYNVLGYLQIGQSSIATARDATSGWLYIAIPSNPSASGWVAAGTQYSSLQGDINSLELKTVSPAEPVIIRNCTYHPMLISPANLLLAPQNEAPNNTGQVPPGDYEAFDQSVNNTQVKTMTLFEGDTVTIYTDGLGNTYSCP
jgi:hypothetical protein